MSGCYGSLIKPYKKTQLRHNIHVMQLESSFFNAIKPWTTMENGKPCFMMMMIYYYINCTFVKLIDNNLY